MDDTEDAVNEQSSNKATSKNRNNVLYSEISQKIDEEMSINNEY